MMNALFQEGQFVKNKKCYGLYYFSFKWKQLYSYRKKKFNLTNIGLAYLLLTYDYLVIFKE